MTADGWSPARRAAQRPKPPRVGMPISHRRRHVDNAKDHFLRAAAALTAWEGQPEAFAMLEACRGLLELVEGDPEQRVRSQVESAIEAMRS